MSDDLLLQLLLFLDLVNRCIILHLGYPPKGVETHKVRTRSLVEVTHHPYPGENEVQQYRENGYVREDTAEV